MHLKPQLITLCHYPLPCQPSQRTWKSAGPLLPLQDRAFILSRDVTSSTRMTGLLPWTSLRECIVRVCWPRYRSCSMTHLCEVCSVNLKFSYFYIFGMRLCLFLFIFSFYFLEVGCHKTKLWNLWLKCEFIQWILSEEKLFIICRIRYDVKHSREKKKQCD